MHLCYCGEARRHAPCVEEVYPVDVGREFRNGICLDVEHGWLVGLAYGVAGVGFSGEWI